MLRMHLKSLLFIAPVALGLVACGPTDVRQLVVEAKYDAAASVIDDDYNSTLGDIDEDDALIWALERAQLAHLAGDLDLADQLLREASVWAESFRGSWEAGRVMAEIGSVTVNDTLRPYEGAGFEHIQIDYWRSLGQILKAQRMLQAYAPPGMELNPSNVAPAVKEEARKIYDRAIAHSQHMTRKELLEVEYAAGRRRYDDDPWARALCAITFLANPVIGNSDRQVANAMLAGALKAYKEEAGKLSANKWHRYEANPKNQLVRTLFMRNGAQYFKGGSDREYFKKLGTEFGLKMDDASLRAAELPAGHGTVIILNHSDFIARTEELQIGFLSGGPPRGSKRFKIGGIGFYARGPGAKVVDYWGALPVPAKLTQLLSPGGAAWMKFEIPVHRPDWKVPAPGVVRVTANDGSSGQSSQLQIVSDIDAYARATLKDEQPALVVKTLLRALLKQAAVAAASAKANEQNALLGFGVNLVGSIGMSVSEQADLRAVHLLPNNVQATMVDVPRGRHQLSLSMGGAEYPLGTVKVEPGAVIVVPIRTFPSPLPKAD